MKKTPRCARGFTLIELMVVMAIITVISTLVLARYGQFNGVVLLRNLAYDVALTVRQAQVYGISGKVGTGTAGVQYGVYFTSANPTQYLLFADNNGSDSYTAGEEIEIYRVRPGYSVYNFCGDLPSGSPHCSLTEDITNMTLLFRRPDPDARISTSAFPSGYTQARIVVRSPSGDTRTVTVTAIGQISIQQGIN